MKVIIDIPEQYVKQSDEGWVELSIPRHEMSIILTKCMPLPKTHGRLIDADVVLDELHNDKREAFTKHDVWLMLSDYYGAPTIIKAEKGE